MQSLHSQPGTSNAVPPQSSSQCAAIRRHLEAGNSITAAEALNAFGCFRLAARINDLSNAGLVVERTLVAVINRDGKKVRVAEYSMRSAMQ